MGYLTQHESALILNKNQLDVQLYLWVNIEVLSTDNIFLLCLWIIQQPAISHYKEPGNTQTRHFNMNFKMIQSTAPCFLSSLQNRPWKHVSDLCHYCCKDQTCVTIAAMIRPVSLLLQRSDLCHYCCKDQTCVTIAAKIRPVSLLLQRSDLCHYSCKANREVNAKVYLLLIYSIAPRTLLFSPQKRAFEVTHIPTANVTYLVLQFFSSNHEINLLHLIKYLQRVFPTQIFARKYKCSG